ncbi:MAG: universal stress protein [Caulobacterales bacterium]
MYQRILLAYDGSLEGAIALREGALLAKRCGAQVFVLSVIPETAGARMAEGVHGDVIAQQIDSYKDLLSRGIARLRQLGLDPVAKLVIGEPAPEIGAYAREIKAELVIVGHHRQSFISRWWSGSTGAYLSDHVGCSVLMACNSISDEAFAAELQKAAASTPA